MSRKVQLLTMPQRVTAGVGAKKTVAATQAAVDALPLASGDWSVEGVPGLFVRAGASAKTYRIMRRIAGRLVVRVLGQMTLAQARRAALKEWARLKPRPPEGKLTLSEAWERYLEERELAPKTQRLYRYNLERYLAGWKARTLEGLGEDRAGVRALYHQLRRQRGVAVAAQVMQMLSAVYRYHRRVNLELPPCPTEVVDVVRSKPRDWALSEEELRAWWSAVSRLRPLKRRFWVTSDQARLLLGQSLGGDVSRGYITPHLVIESLRPLAEAVASRYARVLGWERSETPEPPGEQP